MTVKLAADIWRKYEVAGVPASGPNKPDKTEIIIWGTYLESLLGSSASSLVYATRAALFADLAHGANTSAIVATDATAAYNGLYVKSGASGFGSWSRISDLPTSLVRLTVTGGTGNAIIAEALETPTVPGSKLYLLTPTANNSGATTIVVNGGSAVAIKTALGSDLVTGSLLNNSQVLMAWATDHYQLLISVPVDASGILNDALAAVTAAAAQATAAASSASALGNQVHQYDTRALAIAATVPALVNYVRTLEYASGAGGGALFKRGVAIVNTGADFQSADGAYWNLAEKVFRVRMFGAKGDGTADDTTALQALISSAALTVDIGSGTFVSNLLSVPSDKSIRFDSGTLLKKAGTTGRVLELDGSRIGLYGPGTIDCNDAGTVGDVAGTEPILCNAVSGVRSDIVIDNLKIRRSMNYGIHMVNVDKVTIRNCTIEKCNWNSIAVYWGSESINWLRIHDNLIDRTDAGYDTAAAFGSINILAATNPGTKRASDISIQRNTVLMRNNPVSGVAVELFTDAATGSFPWYINSNISNNQIEGGYFGISVVGVTNGLASNNNVRGSTDVGIEMSYAFFSSIDANTISGGTFGILAAATSGLRNNGCSYSNNVMQGTTSVGIFIGAFSDFANVASNIIQVAGGKGIDISNSLGGSVTGNNLDGATVGTDAINLNGQVAILVTGNRISRWTSSPAIVGDTSSDKIGMNLGSTVSRNFS